MENGEEQEVKQDEETVYTTPEQILAEENETPESSSEEKNEQGETEATEETAEAESEEVEETAQPETPVVPEPKPVPGESPRELALRKEVERLKGLRRKEQGDELFQKKPVIDTPKKAILEKYAPEEIDQFREVFDALADEMGFARKSELQSQTFAEKADDQLQSFLDVHKEYLPENDKDGLLWNQFRDEFALYKEPANPKDLQKLLNKIHGDIFGSQVDIKKINAQKEKIKVASHSGATMGGKAPVRRAQAPSGLRLDGLKGFSEEELADLAS